MNYRLFFAYLRNHFGKERFRYIVNAVKTRFERLGPAAVDEEMLDVGCGYSYPATYCLASLGYKVKGVDIVNCFVRDGFVRFVREKKRSLGYLRGVGEGSLVYFKEILRFKRLDKVINGKKIEHSSLEIQSYDGTRMPFQKEAFSIAFSQDVLEHVVDLDSFWSEICRVLKPGGRIDMVYHNYYSPSGSHGPVYPSDPWGHVFGTLGISRQNSLNKKHPAEICQSAISQGIIIDSIKPVSFAGDVIVGNDPRGYEGVEYGKEWEGKLVKVLNEKFKQLPLQVPGSEIPIQRLIYTPRYLIEGHKP